MIHLHSLFPSETNTSTAGQSSGAPLGKSALDNFHGALSDAVSSTLQKFGVHPNDVKISITSANDATVREPINSDQAIRQTPPSPVTSPSSSSSASSSESAVSGPPDGGYDPFLQAAYSNPFASLSAPATASQSTTAATTSAANTQSPATSSATPLDAQEAFDNAYWAAQPPAVQALRTMPDSDQRTALATQLANEGYSIDVPIMVWGWDPSIVTSMRQAEGYTWVPSALQNPVEDAPGLPALGTVAAYNASNPPPGSIAV